MAPIEVIAFWIGGVIVVASLVMAGLAEHRERLARGRVDGLCRELEGLKEYATKKQSAILAYQEHIETLYCDGQKTLEALTATKSMLDVCCTERDAYYKNLSDEKAKYAALVQRINGARVTCAVKISAVALAYATDANLLVYATQDEAARNVLAELRKQIVFTTRDLIGYGMMEYTATFHPLPEVVDGTQDRV